MVPFARASWRRRDSGRAVRNESRRAFAARVARPRAARSGSGRGDRRVPCRSPRGMARPDRRTRAGPGPRSTAPCRRSSTRSSPAARSSVTELGNPIHPQAIAGVDPEPGAVEADALLLAHNPKIGFDVLGTALPRRPRGALARRRAAQFLDLDYEAREAVCLAGLAFSNPDRVVWEAAAAIPFTAFCAAGNIADATGADRRRLPGDGPPGTAPHGYKRLLLPPPAQPRTGTRERDRLPVDGRAGRRLHRRLRASAARSPPGGWPSSTAPPTQDASVVVLERGKRKGHTDFRQSMDVDHLSDVYGLIQGQGAQIVIANLVGGGSNLYLAASLRSPQRDLRAHATTTRTTAPRRRMWPEADQPRDARPLLRPRRGGAARAPAVAGSEVSKSGGSGRRCCARPATPATGCRWRSTSTAASTRSGATRAASSAPRTR